MRWKQCWQDASAIFASDTPVHPKRASVNAVISAGDEGGVSGELVPGGLKKSDGMRCSTSDTGGSGYMMFSESGRSDEMALNDR